MCKTIVVANGKGGVGKTVTAVSICGELAKRNYRVLLIDFDPQASASGVLGTKNPPIDRSIEGVPSIASSISRYTVFDKRKKEHFSLFRCDPSEYKPWGNLWPDPTEYIEETPFDNLDIILSELGDLTTASDYLTKSANDRSNSFVFTQLLTPLKDKYDFMIFDTNSVPTSYLNTAVFCFCDYILMPTVADPFSIKVINETLDWFNYEIVNERRHNISLIGVFFVRVKTDAAAQKRILSEGQEKFGDAYISTFIKDSNEVINSIDQARPLCDYKASSMPAQQYSQLVDTMLARIDKGLCLSIDNDFIDKLLKTGAQSNEQI